MKYNRKEHEKVKERCLKYLGGKKCKRCGTDYLHSRCYDFHHIGTKKENISKMIARNAAWKDLKEELDKCIILCKNCHTEIHVFKD